MRLLTSAIVFFGMLAAAQVAMAQSGAGAKERHPARQTVRRSDPAFIIEISPPSRKYARKLRDYAP